MSDIDDDDMIDEVYNAEDYIDDEFLDEENIKKNKKNEDDDDEEDDTELDIDGEIDETVVKKQFEIEDNEVQTNNNLNIYVMPSNQRITSEKLSEYEIAEIINIRAVSISNGGVVFTNVDGLSDPIEMAKKELIDRKCPLYIKRQVGMNSTGIFIEKWSPNECSFNVKLNE